MTTADRVLWEKTMNELQGIMKHNYHDIKELQCQHLEEMPCTQVGIRSTQIGALILYLIQKGLID